LPGQETTTIPASAEIVGIAKKEARIAEFLPPACLSISFFLSFFSFFSFLFSFF